MHHSLTSPPPTRRPATRAEQLELPLRVCASPAVRVVRRADGVTELRPHAPQIEGTVRDACRILGGVGPDVIYELIGAGVVEAYKPNPTRKKGRWRVNLTTVWAIKKGEGDLACKSIQERA